MRLPQLNAFAKAQLWGMAVGFALAMLATDRMGYGLGLFFVGFLGSWAAWEYFFARRAPSERRDAPAMAIGIGTGFIIPWGGFLLAALAASLRP
jgi:hypothetical protein